jgi:hypothetical protein
MQDMSAMMDRMMESVMQSPPITFTADMVFFGALLVLVVVAPFWVLPICIMVLLVRIVQLFVSILKAAYEKQITIGELEAQHILVVAWKVVLVGLGLQWFLLALPRVARMMLRSWRGVSGGREALAGGWFLAIVKLFCECLCLTPL